MSRTRTRSSQVYTGSYQWVATSKYGKNKSGISTRSAPDESVTDTVHPHPYVAEDNLFVKRVRSKAARVWFDHQFTREIRRYHGAPLLPHGAGPTFIGVGWDALEAHAVAAVQETKPFASVPLSAAEIADIPRVMADRIGRAASSFLAYQWAIKPLAGDLSRLMSLQKSIAERMRRHRKKQRTRRWGGKGPPVYVLGYAGSGTSTQAIGGGMSHTSSQTTRILEQSAWWSARLEPRIELPEILSQQADADFHSGLYGNANGLQVLYELIPWSFLIDYFSTLGTVVNYHTNLIPYDVPSVCLMNTLKYRRDIYPYDKWYPSFGKTNGYTEHTWKERKVVRNPTVRVALRAILSGGQVANLVALAGALASPSRRS